jgi:hypothetical protein
MRNEGEEVDPVEHAGLQVRPQLLQAGPVHLRSGVSVVDVFLNEHMAGGCDLPLEAATWLSMVPSFF